jgi:3-phenylpropionate/trans-cinnamate dioxygenase ferredoxin reductase subunit
MTTGGATSPRILVVGGSQAGVQLATSLREQGFTGPLTIASSEPHLPYHRPPLSKAGLTSKLAHDDVTLRNQQFFDDRQIRLLLDTAVTRIERATAGGGIAHTEAGESIPFDRLALAVGARPRRLQLQGGELDRVFTLRTLDDARLIRSRLEADTHVVVIGGGFIGLEVAACARALGKTVTVALADDRLMARSVSPLVADAVHAAHTANGVDVRLGTKPTAFLDDGTGRVRSVLFDDGTQVEADLVVVGVGAVPRTELAEQMGLAVDNGVVVDAQCLTSDGLTVAAGDCANVASPVTGRGPEHIRFESVSTAVEQAKVAASTLLGGSLAYRSVPWFWSDQGTLKIQVAGLPFEANRTVVRGVASDGAFSVLHFCDQVLICVECVNRPGDFAILRNVLNARQSVDVDLAHDTAVSLKSIRTRTGNDIRATA